MISVNDFKTGLTVEVEGDIFTVIDFQHVKPGKGAAFVRSKLKNLRNGNTVEKNVPRWREYRQSEYREPCGSISVQFRFGIFLYG